MPYLVASNLPSEAAGKRFRALVERGGILQLPGAHNGMAALQAKAAGFEALYLSGAAMSASMGLPDLGIITVDEVTFFVRQVARASGLPVLVDGDTGYGEALNVMHMVRAFEDAGAGAVQIEDQLLPKKCGHLNNKKLADAHDMAAKIAAAHKARRHLYIVARTDAAESEGIAGTVARAKLYMQAGADAIFPEALTSAEMFAEVAKALPDVPLLANMTEFGRTPFMTASGVREDGIPDGDLAGLFPQGREQGPGRALQGAQARRRHAQFARSDADPRRALRPDRPEVVRGARCLDCCDCAAGGAALRCCGGGGRRWFLVSVNGSAAIAGSVEECDQMPGACEHAVAVQRPGGPFEVKADDRRLGSRVAGFDFVVRDELQLKSLSAPHGVLLQDGSAALPLLVAA